MSIKRIISTSKSYLPVGPYNQAVLANNTLYVSGVVGLEKDGSRIVEGGAAAQARKALTHLGAILEAAGASYSTVVKTTILLANIDDFANINAVYKEFFTASQPARSTYQVAKLPLNADVEIEVIALVGEVKIVGPEASS